MATPSAQIGTVDGRISSQPFTTAAHAPKRSKNLLLIALTICGAFCLMSIVWVVWTGYKNVERFEGVWLQDYTLEPNQAIPDVVMVVSSDRTFEFKDLQFGTISKGTWSGAGMYVTTTSTPISGQGSISYKFADSDHLESVYGYKFTRLPGGLTSLAALEPKWRELHSKKDSLDSLVVTYLFWGIEHSGRGLEGLLKKFDSEHPGSGLRQRLIDEWHRSFSKVYDDQSKSHPGGW